MAEKYKFTKHKYEIKKTTTWDPISGPLGLLRMLTDRVGFQVRQCLRGRKKQTEDVRMKKPLPNSLPVPITRRIGKQLSTNCFSLPLLRKREPWRTEQQRRLHAAAKPCYLLFWLCVRKKRVIVLFIFQQTELDFKPRTLVHNKSIFLF